VIEAGVPLSRAWLHIRTLHPESQAYPESGDAACKPRSAFSTLASRSGQPI
jgi:hypothetical protein